MSPDLTLNPHAQPHANTPVCGCDVIPNKTPLTSGGARSSAVMLSVYMCLCARLECLWVHVYVGAGGGEKENRGKWYMTCMSATREGGSGE